MQAMNTAGLCTDCVHTRALSSDRGSVFHMCQLGLKNPAFPKYPRLPVLRCPGYEKPCQTNSHTPDR